MGCGVNQMNIVDESPKDSGLGTTRTLVVGDTLGPSSVAATADRIEGERREQVL